MQQSAKTYFQYLIETSHRPPMVGWDAKKIAHFRDLLKEYIRDLASD